MGLIGPTTVWVWKSAWKCLRSVEISFLRRKKTVFPFSDFLLWKVPSVPSLGGLHKHQQRLAAIEPARYTILKKMKLTDFTPQIPASPSKVWGWAVESHGVEPSSRWRLRALRRLRSDTSVLGCSFRPHRRGGAAPRCGRRRGCCWQLWPGAPEPADGDDRGWSGGMIWCRVSERTTSVESCLVILNASCAQSCGRIGGN